METFPITGNQKVRQANKLSCRKSTQIIRLAPLVKYPHVHLVSSWNVGPTADRVDCVQLLPVTQSDIVIHISRVGSQAKPKLDGVLKHITLTFTRTVYMCDCVSFVSFTLNVDVFSVVCQSICTATASFCQSGAAVGAAAPLLCS